MSGSSDEEESWIEWFCGLTGHEYFCEVDRSYIEDSFNLYGLRSFIPNYQASLDTILDVSADLGEGSQAEEEAPTYAKVLYGMIHARYILTTRGLEAMARKFQNDEFGVCPRALCGKQSVVPAGLYDEVSKSNLKVFCPKCQDLYAPNADFEDDCVPDGAYFGTTFPHLLFMTFPSLEPTISKSLYVPRIFGYRIKGKNQNPSRLSNVAAHKEHADIRQGTNTHRGENTKPNEKSKSAKHQGNSSTTGKNLKNKGSNSLEPKSVRSTRKRKCTT